MTLFQTHVSLRPFNTFGVEAFAERVATLHTETEAREALERHGPPARILGGGSNVLITQPLAGTTWLNRIGGLHLAEARDAEVVVRAGGGVVWHELVMWAVRQGLGGIENLALIPGTVGAAPIQNIGAYGVELKDVFERLEALHLPTGEIHVFEKSDCRFGYRDSVFKRGARGQYLILHVWLRLRKKGHQPDTSYHALADWLRQRGITRPTIAQVAEAVIAIRSSKLPDPRVLGNAGSFFKNPVLPEAQVQALLEQHPAMPSWPAGAGMRKVPAGWLIEQCGWKGRREGPVGCHERQALVIVNHGGATGAQILAFAKKIQASVQERFGIALEPEVNVW